MLGSSLIYSATINVLRTMSYKCPLLLLCNEVLQIIYEILKYLRLVYSQAFPMLKFFHQGSMYDYRGPRNAEQLLEFARVSCVPLGYYRTLISINFDVSHICKDLRDPFFP